MASVALLRASVLTIFVTLRRWSIPVSTRRYPMLEKVFLTIIGILIMLYDGLKQTLEDIWFVHGV